MSGSPGVVVVEPYVFWVVAFAALASATAAGLIAAAVFRGKGQAVAARRAFVGTLCLILAQGVGIPGSALGAALLGLPGVELPILASVALIGGGNLTLAAARRPSTGPPAYVGVALGAIGAARLAGLFDSVPPDELAAVVALVAIAWIVGGGGCVAFVEAVRAPRPVPHVQPE